MADIKSCMTFSDTGHAGHDQQWRRRRRELVHVSHSTAINTQTISGLLIFLRNTAW